MPNPQAQQDNREMLLDLWWEHYPDDFDYYYERYGPEGAVMLRRLRQFSLDRFKTLKLLMRRHKIFIR